LRGKLFRQLGARGEQFLFTAGTEDDIRAFAQEMPAMVLPSPWLPPVMSVLRPLSFMLTRGQRKVFNRRQVFQFLFQKTVGVHKNALAHVGTIFAQSALRNSCHSVQTNRGVRALYRIRDLRRQPHFGEFAGQMFHRRVKGVNARALARRFLHNSTAALRRSVSVLAV